MGKLIAAGVGILIPIALVRVPQRWIGRYVKDADIPYKAREGAGFLGYLTGVVNETCADYAVQSREAWKKAVPKYQLEDARIEPLITLAANDNWIEFTAPYIVDYRKRRLVKDRLFTRILEEVDRSNNRIRLASATFELTSVPRLEVPVCRGQGPRGSTVCTVAGIGTDEAAPASRRMFRDDGRPQPAPLRAEVGGVVGGVRRSPDPIRLHHRRNSADRQRPQPRAWQQHSRGSVSRIFRIGRAHALPTSLDDFELPRSACEAAAGWRLLPPSGRLMPSAGYSTARACLPGRFPYPGRTAAWRSPAARERTTQSAVQAPLCAPGCSTRTFCSRIPPVIRFACSITAGLSPRRTRCPKRA